MKKGDLITILWINGLAMTSTLQVIVVSFDEINQIIEYKDSPRKRKTRRIRINPSEMIVLAGHDTLVSDMKGDVMRGNACMNIVSNKSDKEVHEILMSAIVKPSEKLKSKIFLFTEEEAADSMYEEKAKNVLYPEYNQHFPHAIIDRALLKQ